MELTPRQQRYLIEAFKRTSAVAEYFDPDDVVKALKLSPGEATDTLKALKDGKLILTIPVTQSTVDRIKAGDASVVVRRKTMSLSWIAGDGSRSPPPTAEEREPSAPCNRLTTEGREKARHLLDDRKAARRGRFWKFLLYVWGVLVSLSIPVTTAYLNAKINAQRTPPPATSQP